MARVKPKRQGIHLDMTAMSDMAWLLLTFFILTTQFKKPDIVEVKTPSSVAETKLADGDIIRVSLNKDGKYYFGIVDDKNKIPILEKMGQKYGLSFNDAEKAAFMKTVEVPVPIRALNQYLNLSEGQRASTIPGIPLDSTDLQLVDWIELSLEHDPNIKLAIKGDIKTQYPKVKELIKQLQQRDINKFQLITSSEVKPK